MLTDLCEMSRPFRTRATTARSTHVERRTKSKEMEFGFEDSIGVVDVRQIEIVKHLLSATCRRTPQLQTHDEVFHSEMFTKKFMKYFTKHFKTLFKMFQETFTLHD